MKRLELNLILILIISLYIFYVLKRTKTLKVKVIALKGRIVLLTVVTGLLLSLSFILKDGLLVIVSLMASLSFFLTIKGEGLTEDGVNSYDMLRKYNGLLKFIDFSDLRDISLKEGRNVLVFKAEGSLDKGIYIRMNFKKEDRDKILKILSNRNISI